MLYTKLGQDFISELDTDDLTTDVSQAIYIIEDGSMVSGGYYDGERTNDHNIVKSCFEPSVTWEQLFNTYNFVMLVPEHNIAYVKDLNSITEQQRDLLNKTSYAIEIFN